MVVSEDGVMLCGTEGCSSGSPLDYLSTLRKPDYSKPPFVGIMGWESIRKRERVV